MSDTTPVLTVRELKALNNASGRPFAALVLVKRLASKTAANGNPFLSVELGDKGGSFSCTIFADSPLHDALKNAGEGAIAWIEGRIDSYQGRFSPKIGTARILSEQEISATAGL
ncbi:MAG: phosphohydrolase, partial [Opitutaceae bacterium]